MKIITLIVIIIIIRLLITERNWSGLYKKKTLKKTQALHGKQRKTTALKEKRLKR